MSRSNLSDPCKHCTHTRYSHKDLNPEQREVFNHTYAEDVPDGRCMAVHCTCAGFELDEAKHAEIRRAAAAALERATVRGNELERAGRSGKPFDGIDTRERFELIANEATRDIDAGVIKLSDAAAARELARLAEEKHAREAGEPFPVAVTVPAGFEPHLVSANRPLHSATFNGEPMRRVSPSMFVKPGHLKPAHGLHAFPTERECDSLAFCFEAAARDHGGARRIRSLLFAWHNGQQLGGFDFADLWSLDDTYRGHALTVIGMIARSPCGWYAEHYGYAADMEALIEQYGPRGVQRSETCATCGLRHSHWCDTERRHD